MGDDELEGVVLGLIRFGVATDAESIAEVLHLPVADVLALLKRLEVRGALRRRTN
jgi:hypothetical protein